MEDIATHSESFPAGGNAEYQAVANFHLGTLDIYLLLDGVKFQTRKKAPRRIHAISGKHESNRAQNPAREPGKRMARTNQRLRLQGVRENRAFQARN